MGCGGLEKSARIRRRMEYNWSESWTIRGLPSFLSPRRTKRPQRRPYEVLGTSRSTKRACSLGGSNMTYMNLKAWPWLIDFHAAAALDSFPFFWVALLRLILVFSTLRGMAFSPWVVCGVFCILRSGFGVLLACLGQVWGGYCFCCFFSVLPTPPTQCWAMVWVIGPQN